MTAGAAQSGGMMTSGGSLSILKRPIGGAESSGSGSVNPISNMTKLLQAQAPGLPPHIIAQQALPSRSSPKVRQFKYIYIYFLLFSVFFVRRHF